MKPAPFRYHDPSTVDEVVTLLGRLEEAKVLAGGQSLMPLMNLRMTGFDDLIDLKGVQELQGITVTSDQVTIGSMTRQRACEHSDALAEALPILREALGYVGHPQTRNRGTIGGSLAHLDPTAELVGVASVLDAQIIARSTAGERRIPFDRYPEMTFVPDLTDQELITEVVFPRWPEDHGWAFEEFAPRHGDFAIAAAAALVSLNAEGAIDRIAVALLGMSEIGVRVGDLEQEWRGQKPSEALFAGVAEHVRRFDATPDIHGPAAYRQHLAGVLAQRALRHACDRAGSRLHA